MIRRRIENAHQPLFNFCVGVGVESSQAHDVIRRSCLSQQTVRGVSLLIDFLSFHLSMPFSVTTMIGLPYR